MKEFDKLYEQVERIVAKDNIKDEFGYLACIMEEAGEVSRCILEDNGFKKRKQTESSLSECADILNSLLGLYIKLGGTRAALMRYATKKTNRWEKRINDRRKSRS